MSLSRTAAIREARRIVSPPARRSATDFIVYGPRDDGDPHGQRAAIRADGCHKAAAARTRWVARVALALMGRLDAAARSVIEHESHSGHSNRVEDLVAAALRVE